MKRSLIILAFVALLGAGCNSDKSNIRPPQKLVPLTSGLDVSTLWDVRIGDGTEKSGVRMRPAVADGVVYAASLNGKLRAINAETGATLWQNTRNWRKDKDTSYAGGPVLANGVLFIGTLDGHVFAVDAATGAEQWQAMLGAEVLSSPAVYQDLVLARTGDGKVHALNIADGSSKWIYDHGNVPLLSLRGNGGLLAAGGAVFFGTDDGKLVAIGAADGAALWEQSISDGDGRTDIERLADADGSLRLQGDALYVSAYHGRMLAVDAASGQPRWSNEFSSYTGLDVEGSTVIGVDDASVVWAFDTATGGNLWKQDALEWRWLSAPAIQGNYVVVGDLDGYVHWLDLGTGKIVARAELSNDAIRARPVVVGDVVYVEDVAGHLAAFRLNTP